MSTTPQSWSFAADHQSDAGFRAWGSDFSAKLAACGLVQTSDTGQINWTTVTRPGTNTDGGYEIWKFADSVAGSAPIYIRFNYGTGAVATRPRIQCVVGTGSNGSGTITGTALTGTLACSAAQGTATGSAFTSYMTHTEGLFFFVWQAGGATSNLARATLFVNRTLDSDGNPTVTGAIVHHCNGASSATSSNGQFQALRFAATAVAYNATNNPVTCLIPAPNGTTGTLASGNPQAFLFWSWSPTVTPIKMCCVKLSEITEGSTFTATLFGSTSRTFICLGQEAALQWSADSPTLWAMAAVWEGLP